MSEDVLTRFGSAVRNEREKQDLSQEELAERAGMHRTYVGMVERAEKNITLRNISKIANALGLSLKDLFSKLEQ